MRKFVLPGVIAVAAVAALALLAFGVSRSNDTSSIDSKVASNHFPVPPDYATKLHMLGSDKQVSLASYRGKVVLMNVFASWCDAVQGRGDALASASRRCWRRTAGPCSASATTTPRPTPRASTVNTT